MTRFHRKLSVLVASLVALMATVPAMAGTATGSIASSVTLTSDCSLLATPVLFGKISTLTASQTKATGTMQLTCTGNTTATVSIGAGQGVGATTGARYMTDINGDQVRYTLYKDNTGTVAWDTSLSVPFTNTGTTTLTAVGSIVTGQAIVPGNYVDLVTITVAY